MRNFKLIIRSFLRRPTTNLINVFGLSVSLALVITLSAYCYSELTTDKHQENRQNAYLFSIKSEYTGTGTAWELKNKIDEYLPNVEYSIRIGTPDNAPVFSYKDKEIKPNLVFVDNEFFDIFSYKIVEGNLSTALNDPLGIILTESFAKRMFGNESAIGKTINVENNNLLTVTAVIEQAKNKSFLSFNALATHETHKILEPYRQFNGWDETSFLTFIRIPKEVNPQEVAQSVLSLYPENFLKKVAEMGIEFSAQMTSIDDVYFSDLVFWQSNIIKGNKQKSLILLMVSGLVLIIALLNFISISTFQWYNKVKQIGTMKVFGANPVNVAKHLFSESLIIFVASFILAVFTVKLIAPIIQRITGLHFNLELIYSYQFLSLSLVSTVLLCIIVSVGPILKIASSKVINNLQKKLVTHKRKSSTKVVLVEMQFAIAIVLIAFTLLVQKQIYFGSANIGFEKDMNIAIPFNRQMWGKNDVFKDFFEKTPMIDKYSFTQFYPGKEFSSSHIYAMDEGEEKELEFYRFCADAAFFDLMKLEFIKGHSFVNNSTTAKYNVIVNETFVNKYNILNPIGLKLPMNKGTFNIVGVIKDFHYQPVTKEIAPLVIRNLGYTSVCLISIPSKDFNTVHSTIEKVKKFTASLSPNFPVEVKFLDQAVDDMYKSEIQFRRTFSLFTVAAIIICCLGVFAMSLFACQKRMKEIGVRKVNGATVWEVIILLNYKFFIQVLIAFLIATPVAYYIMNKWLESFAYKTQIDWWLFVIAGLSVLIITLLTVTLQSWNTARRNPIYVLRYE